MWRGGYLVGISTLRKQNYDDRRNLDELPKSR